MCVLLGHGQQPNDPGDDWVHVTPRCIGQLPLLKLPKHLKLSEVVNSTVVAWPQAIDGYASQELDGEHAVVNLLTCWDDGISEAPVVGVTACDC